MYYLFQSHSGLYQVCQITNAGCRYGSFSDQIQLSLNHNTQTSVKSVQDRLDAYLAAESNRPPLKLIAQANSLEDFPNLYPELFI